MANYALVAGVGLANSAVGSFLTALGLVLQQQANFRRASLTASKYAQPGVFAEDAANSQAKVPLRDPQYLAGLLCVVLGAISAVFCDGLLPQSTLAPLQCQTIVYKLLLGKVLLKEALSRTTWAAILLMIVGMIISVCGANLYDASYTLATLLDLFLQPAALLYTLLAGAALFIMRRLLKIFFANDFSSWMGLAYLTLASSMIAGWTGTLVKALVELSITASNVGTRDFRHLGTYVFIILVPWLTSMKLKYVNVGLKHFSSDVFMPLYQATVIACCAVCGIFYYLDFNVLMEEEENLEYESEVDPSAWADTDVFDVDDTEATSSSSSSSSSSSTSSSSSSSSRRSLSSSLSGALGATAHVRPFFLTNALNPRSYGSTEYHVTRVLRSHKSNGMVAQSAGSNLIVYGIGCSLTILGVLLMLKQQRQFDTNEADEDSRGKDSKTYGEFLSNEQDGTNANAIDGGGAVYAKYSRVGVQGGSIGEYRHSDPAQYDNSPADYYYGGFSPSSGKRGAPDWLGDPLGSPPAGSSSSSSSSSSSPAVNFGRDFDRATANGDSAPLAGEGDGGLSGAGGNGEGHGIGSSSGGAGGVDNDPQASMSLLRSLSKHMEPGDAASRSRAVSTAVGAGGAFLSSLAGGASELVESLTGASPATGVGAVRPYQPEFASPEASHDPAFASDFSHDFAPPPASDPRPSRAPLPQSFTSIAAAGNHAQHTGGNVLEL